MQRLQLSPNLAQEELLPYFINGLHWG